MNRYGWDVPASDLQWVRIEDSPLAAQFPNLFHCVVKPTARVCSYISRSGTWGLGPRFRRKLTETEETQFQDLLISLNRIYLPIEVSNGGSWKPSTDGDYSVASFCIALSGDLHTP